MTDGCEGEECGPLPPHTPPTSGPVARLKGFAVGGGVRPLGTLRRLLADRGIPHVVTNDDDADALDWRNLEELVLVVWSPPSIEGARVALSEISASQQENGTCFRVLFSPLAANSAEVREEAFFVGAAMISADPVVVTDALSFVFSQGGRGGTVRCPTCLLGPLTENQLWRHYPMYHYNSPDRDPVACPICVKGGKMSGSELMSDFVEHLYYKHAPASHPIPLDASVSFNAFALAIVRHPSNRYLVVQEVGGLGFWFPGGKVDVGETPMEACVRETREEAGIDVTIKGIIKMSYALRDGRAGGGGGVTLRVYFYCEPIDPNQLPKSMPDFESAGACYIALSDTDRVKMRSREPQRMFEVVESGGKIHSADILIEQRVAGRHRRPDLPRRRAGAYA